MSATDKIFSIKARVHIYSTVEKTELFLDGHSAGCYQTGENTGYDVVCELPYEPGLLTAKSTYEDGTEEVFEMRTADQDALKYGFLSANIGGTGKFLKNIQDGDID